MAQTRTSEAIPRLNALPGLYVDPAWLAGHAHAPNLRIVDARPPGDFAEGHIPGAVNLELATITTIVDGVGGMLVDAGTFAAVMSSLGIDRQGTVVVYDSNWGLPASRILWALTYFGQEQVAILNGGWDLWEEEQRPVSTATATLAPTHFAAEPTPQHLADLAWLQAHLEDPDVVVLDTRAAGEVAHGRVPGARHWDWMNGVPAGSWHAVRPADELRAELAALGVTPDKEIVTYCRSGVRAAHTYVLLRSLGYPRVRNYDGSWLEWSQRVLGLDHA